jgi:hypothetical protein
LSNCHKTQGVALGYVIPALQAEEGETAFPQVVSNEREEDARFTLTLLPDDVTEVRSAPGEKGIRQSDQSRVYL